MDNNKKNSNSTSNNVRIGRKDLSKVHNRDKLKHIPPKPNYELYYPKTIEEIQKITTEFYDWAQTTTSTNINDFAISKKMSPYRFKRIENENFQAVLQLVKYMFAGKNRELLLKREFDKDIYLKELYQLDQDFRDDENEKFAKRRASALMGGVIKIESDSIYD